MRRDVKTLVPDNSLAAPVTPVIAWPLPSAKNNAAKPHSKAPIRRNRKKRFNGLQLVIAQWQIDRMEACARCMGIKPRDFLYYAVCGAIREVEDRFGASCDELVRMTPDQRAELGSQYRLVNWATLSNPRVN